MKQTIFLTTALALAALSACGLRGDLERPDPLFDNPGAEGVQAAGEIPGASIEDRLNEPDFDEPAPEDDLLGGPVSEEEGE
ncbi:MAG: lipoprotein [Pseudomonadota bacterium]